MQAPTRLDPPGPGIARRAPAVPARFSRSGGVTGSAGEPLARLTRVLWHLLGGTRGGPLRIRILRELEDRPFNTNQLAENLGIDYKTAQHHLRVLTENRVVSPTGTGYGAVFLFTPEMEESREVFHDIAARVSPKKSPGTGRSSHE